MKWTSILKVLHGSTKSPTGCMYTWRYNILYLTILYNIRNVSVFVCIAFKNPGDWLHAKNEHNICKGTEKKSGKLFHLWKLLSLRQVFPRKINEVRWNSNSLWKSWWLTFMQNIRWPISASVKEKIAENCLIAEITKSKVHDFTINGA